MFIRKVRIEKGAVAFSEYLLFAGVGAGTYGTVFRSFNLKQSCCQVLKRMNLARFTGFFNVVSVREMTALLNLQAGLVVQLVDLFVRKKFLYLAFESLSADLKKTLKTFPAFF